MTFSQLAKREKRLLWITSAVILGYAGYTYLLEPGYNFLSKLNNEVLSKEIQLLKNRRIISQKDKISTVYNKFSRTLQIKGSLEEELADTLKVIESISKASNLYLVDIKPGIVKDMGFYKRLIIVVEAEGEINHLTKFIYQLSSKLLTVSSLRLKAKSGTKGVLSAQLVISRILEE
ncbi:MAG: hypothetical protein AB1414_08040 [bacterium]